MPKSIPTLIKTHIKNNIIIYFIVLLCFLIGISVGGFTVKVINPTHKQEVVAYLRKFFQLFHNEDLNNFDIFSQSLINNMQLLSLNWILGMLIIGIPGIIFIIVFKGFVIGFTVGLLVEQFRLKGALIFLFGVLPQNTLIIPVFLAAAVVSISFTLMLIKNKLNKSKEVNLHKQFLKYTIVYLLFAALVLISVSIESFISPIFIKMVSVYI